MGKKYAAVTGCNRGLGHQIALRLVQEGFKVALVCRRLKDAVATAAILGPECCLPVQLDLVSTEGKVQEAAATIALWLEGCKLMVLVNNAGNSYGTWDEIAWTASKLVNYRGPVSLTAALLPSLADGASVTMVGSGLGALELLSPKFRRYLTQAQSIEDLDSIAGKPIKSLGIDRSWVGPYGLSKALLHRASEILASDAGIREKQIVVNAVCPGWVCTDMGGDQAPISVEEGAEHILEKALQSTPATTGTFVCYCYKNYDDEHNRAWEEKHGKWAADSARYGKNETWEEDCSPHRQDVCAKQAKKSRRLSLHQK